MIFSEAPYADLSFSESSGVLTGNPDYIEVDLIVILDICFDQRITTQISDELEIVTSMKQDRAITTHIDFDRVTL